MLKNRKLLDALVRNDFSSFIHKVFTTINPGKEYHGNWHINLIAEYLEEVRAGNIKRLIINMPPRALKSVCTSVAWPAWLLAKNPSARILAASYSQVLSIKHSMDTRFVLNADWYRESFVNTKLSKKHNQKSKFMTTENGFRFATSVGGSVTGEGGDYLIIDDPHNPSQIDSKKFRDRVIGWYDQTFSSRLNDQKSGAIILVMQRLHEDDLTSHLLNCGGWELLKIPAIADEDMIYLAKNKYVYKKGSYLHAKRDSKEFLLNLQRNTDARVFASQYMQAPLPSNYNLLSPEDIVFWETLPDCFEYYVQSWDTAIKVNENADYSVCTIYGVKEGVLYLISMIRKKMSYPELKIAALTASRKYRPKYILIEDKASGQSLIQDMRIICDHRIQAIRPKIDKVTRFASCIPSFQSGQIKLPAKASYKKNLMKEILEFPSAKNDDIVDSISQMILYHKDDYSKKVRAKIRTI